MLPDKLSENLPDALSNDYDIWDKLSNYCDILDKLSNYYNLLDRLSNDYDICSYWTKCQMKHIENKNT